MPVLARTFENAGFSTILVTMMPFWVEKVGVPRTLAVEFPFAYTLGLPNDVHQQRRVLLEALAVLETATAPGIIVDSKEKWQLPTDETIKLWQPAEPSPIIKLMAPKIRTLLRERRRKKS